MSPSNSTTKWNSIQSELIHDHLNTTIPFSHIDVEIKERDISPKFIGHPSDVSLSLESMVAFSNRIHGTTNCGSSLKLRMHI